MRLDGGSQRMEQRGFPRPTVACDHAHQLVALVSLDQVLKGLAMRRAPRDEPRVGGQRKGIFCQSVKVFHQRLFSGSVVMAAERGVGRAPGTVAGRACHWTRWALDAGRPAQLADGLSTWTIIDPRLEMHLHGWTLVRDRGRGCRQCTPSSMSRLGNPIGTGADTPGVSSALTLRSQHLDPHLTLPPLLQAEPFRRCLGEVDQVLLRFGAPVINGHLALLLCLE